MSGALFNVQTAAFRRLLGDGHEYTFLDGLLDSSCVLGRSRIPDPPSFYGIMVQAHGIDNHCAPQDWKKCHRGLISDGT
jgi:hypothetical protein